MDGWTDGRTDRPMDGWINRPMGGLTGGRMDGPMRVLESHSTRLEMAQMRWANTHLKGRFCGTSYLVFSCEIC